MLINTSFTASKEEDFAFSFPLPVKSFTAPCLAKGHGLEPEIPDYVLETSRQCQPLSLEHGYIVFLNYPVNILGLVHIHTATISCPAP